MRQIKRTLSMLLLFAMLLGFVPEMRIEAEAGESIYDYYSEIVERIENIHPFSQVQSYRYDDTFSEKKSGICNVCAMTTLLNRRLTYDGRSGSFSLEDVLRANGCTDIKSQETKYAYSGGTSSCYEKAYTTSGTTYQAVGINYKDVYKSCTQNEFQEYIANLLLLHPEGIVLRAEYPTGGGHALVIYKYAIVNGRYQFYVKDPVHNYSGKYEGPGDGYDSWLYYKDGSFNNLYKYLHYISYLQGSQTTEQYKLNHPHCNHKWDSDGNCVNKCGAIYDYASSFHTKEGEIIPNYQRVAVNERPYAASPEISVYRQTSIPVVGTVVNHFGNTWYNVIDPDTGREGYVYCAQKEYKLLTAYYEDGTGRIYEGDPIHKPQGELPKGKSFRMEGTLVSSKYDFSSITIKILNADGSVATRKDNGKALLYSPLINSCFKEFDIHDANDAIAISKLNSGNYRLIIEAYADTSSFSGSNSKRKQVEAANHFLEQYDFRISGGGGTNIPTYTVTMDSNGGTTTNQKKQVKSGESISLWEAIIPKWLRNIFSDPDSGTTSAVITAPQLGAANYIQTSTALYTFEGWSEDPNASVPEYKATDTFTPSSSTTLYAVWSEIEKPASPNMTQQSMDIAQNGNVSVSWWPVSNAEKYVATVYTTDGSEYRRLETVGTTAAFNMTDAGEYTVRVRAANSAGESGDSQSVSIHVHAPSTVSFLNHDGSVWASQSVPYGGNAIAPSDPNRKGYTFAGWSGSLLNVKENRTLTANYRAIPYEVTFYGYDGKGGYLPVKVDTVYYSGDTPGCAVPPAESQLNVKEGASFLYWDNEDWKSVTRDNIKVYPCSVWNDQEAPISTNIAEVIPEGDGYWIKYSVTNEIATPQTGRIVVALKSAVGRFLSKTESGAFYLAGSGNRSGSIYVPVDGSVPADEREEAYAELYVVKNYNSLVPISQVSWDVLGSSAASWTDWMSEAAFAAYSGDKSHVQSKTEYRTSKRETKDWTEQASIAGWTQIDQRTIKSDYGAWSQWSATPVSANDNCKVETRQVMVSAAYTEYRYGRWIRGRADNNMCCPAAFKSGSPDPVLDYSAWSTSRFQNVSTGWTCRNQSAGGRAHDHSHVAYYDSDGDPIWYLYSANGSSDKATRYFWEESREIPATYTTQYRYATRQDITQYRYERWTGWSAWSETQVSATSDLRVESQKQYRVKKPIESGGEGGETLSGTVTGISNPSNKLAVLAIYKVDEASDYSLEYISQTRLGADGSYCFTGISTFEDPSVKTGDFTATLTVQGSDGPMFLDTSGKFKAPKPQYTVRFIDEVTGALIGEPQIVEEGGSAIAPEVPDKEGYTFLGWEYGLNNIREDMEINARYVKNNYVVVFVDWMHGTITMLENVPYGSVIYSYSGENVPEGDVMSIRDPEDVNGYAFLGWKADDGQDLGTVTRNMVVNAVYDRFTYKVTFLDSAGNIINEQDVGYGDCAGAPDIEDMTVDENMMIAGWSDPSFDYVTKDMTVSPVMSYLQDAYPAEPSLAPGVYAGTQTLSFESPSESAVITYLMIGGSGETSGDQSYTGPITLTDSAVIEVTTEEENANSVTERYEYVIVPDTSRPEAPASLTATAGNESVSLRWSAVQGADGYIVNRVDQYGNESRFMTDTSAYVDNSVRAVSDYTYTVGSYGIYREGESETFLASDGVSEPAELRFFGESNAVEEITINAPSRVLSGSSVPLSAEVTPSTALDPSVSWSVVPGTGAAKITNNGVLSASAPGIVTVNATANDGSGVSASVDLEIYTYDPVEEPDSAAIHIDSASVSLGKQTTVSVSIDAGSNVSMIQFKLNYDSSILSLVSAEPGSIEQVNTAAINAAQDGAVYYAWDANEGLSQGGTLLELTFKAIGYDEEGTLIYIDGADSDDSEFVFAKVSDDGMGGEEIPCVIFNGSVSVLNIVYGDVNGDGKVNIIDANMVRRYSAKMIDFDDYQLAAADVSGDEKVNVLDANYIRRYSAKLIDTFPVI